MSKDKDDDDVINLDEGPDLGRDPRDPYTLTKPAQRHADVEYGQTTRPLTEDELARAMTRNMRESLFLEGGEGLERIGQAILKYPGRLTSAARELGMTKQDLQMMIRTEPVLHAYWKTSFRAIKSLVDERVMDMLEAPDENKDIVRMVWKTLYSGRRNGAYDPNTFGADGYDDPVARANEEEVRKNVQEAEESKNPTVVLVFNQKQIVVGGDESPMEALMTNIVDGQIVGGEDTGGED